MQIKTGSQILTVLIAACCASNAMAEGQTGFAAGTQYQLLTADAVTFGPGIQNQSRKDLLFKLSSGKPQQVDAVGPEDDSTVWSGDLVFDRIDFLKPGEVRMHDVVDGISYSAGIEVTKTEEFDSQSEIVSSRQLGIHYGRLGPENYSSVDLSLRHINDEATEATGAEEDKDLWSLGVTTGKRFSLTGLDSNDPLWTVSLRGQFSVADSTTIDEALESQQWYVSPGLQWSRDSFRLTADVLMPFMQTGELEEESDYRVRAKIQKRF